MAINREKTTQKLVSMPKEMAQAIADYRFANRLPSEAEAIRRLIAKGLEASEKA
ncbi:hypothetical protein [Komagataeibacter europaeus]|uniref:hypothetical protein n=1 Tax=Komagataeibacter europaeus TaxID=33995 RepID=UPI000373CEBA|nr:hypothetical protein [Komagataeibacter europaeus]GBQ46530.1 hypothetical protein AA18890_2626 [Komagataeibacter europaeus LMG 18890]